LALPLEIFSQGASFADPVIVRPYQSMAWSLA